MGLGWVTFSAMSAAADKKSWFGSRTAELSAATMSASTAATAAATAASGEGMSTRPADAPLRPRPCDSSRGAQAPWQSRQLAEGVWQFLPPVTVYANWPWIRRIPTCHHWRATKE